MNSKGKKIIFYIMLFGVFFLAFNNNKILENEEVYGDEAEYKFVFDEATIEGEKLVLFDNNAENEIRYYVYNFTGDQCVKYTYYFLGSEEKFYEKYELVSENVVDYSEPDYMLKTLDSVENFTYEEVLNSYQEDINLSNVYILY